MHRVTVLRLILFAALLFSLVRVVIIHAAHVGPIEWLVVVLLAVALVVALVAPFRRSASHQTFAG